MRVRPAAATAGGRRRRDPGPPVHWLRPLAAAVLGALFVSPLLIMLLGALHPPGQPPPVGLGGLVPNGPTLAGFDAAFALVDLGGQLVNSLIVVSVAVPLTVLSASLAGFAMARLRGPLRSTIAGITLIGLVVPMSALWIPRFALFKELGMLDSYAPLIAPALVGSSPFFVLLFFWSFRRLPADLYDAARLEGLGPLRTWWRVGVPLTTSTAFAVGALAFALHWSNFMEPLLYLFDPEKYTLPLGLSALRQLGPTDVPVLLSASIVATVPPIIAFALVQRRFLDQTRGAGWLGR